MAKKCLSGGKYWKTQPWGSGETHSCPCVQISIKEHVVLEYVCFGFSLNNTVYCHINDT